MRKELIVKLKESFLSILPIFLMVIFLHVTFVPLTNNLLSSFFVGTLFLILGMALFTLGADNAMMPMGNKVGAFLSKHKKLMFLIVVSFLFQINQWQFFLFLHLPID